MEQTQQMRQTDPLHEERLTHSPSGALFVDTVLRTRCQEMLNAQAGSVSASTCREKCSCLCYLAPNTWDILGCCWRFR